MGRLRVLSRFARGVRSERVPNTLVHFAAQGAASHGLWRRLDPRWVYLGCLLPDLPWILRRAVVGLRPPGGHVRPAPLHDGAGLARRHAAPLRRPRGAHRRAAPGVRRPRPEHAPPPAPRRDRAEVGQRRPPLRAVLLAHDGLRPAAGREPRLPGPHDRRGAARGLRDRPPEGHADRPRPASVTPRRGRRAPRRVLPLPAPVPRRGPCLGQLLREDAARGGRAGRARGRASTARRSSRRRQAASSGSGPASRCGPRAPSPTTTRRCRSTGRSSRPTSCAWTASSSTATDRDWPSYLALVLLALVWARPIRRRAPA